MNIGIYVEKERFDIMGISYGYKNISKNEITNDLLVGWKDQTIPISQRKLTESQLKEMYNGEVNPLFSLLEKCVRESYTNDSSILEIGCSTGYYYEILNYLLQTKIKYTGVDYSSAMINAAKNFYPNATFIESDGANLPFDNKEFSIVISGSILLHVQNYHNHIEETARVANNRIIVHRSMLCKKRSTYFQRKKAYDIDVLEVRINENELLNLFQNEGFELLHTYEYITEVEKDCYESTHILGRIQ